MLAARQRDGDGAYGVLSWKLNNTRAHVNEARIDAVQRSRSLSLTCSESPGRG
jgi:hypothetical protein